MQAGPLIVRELREQSRRPATHWLRVLGAAGVVLITYQLMGNPVGGGVRLFPAGASGLIARNLTWLETLEVGLRQFENRGSALFSLMNLALLAGIWLVGPMLTADCLSRERREGTLGLLFLTPLRAWDIVVAKLVASGLRAGTVLLAALPVLVLPILMGGLSWETVLRTALLDLAALILALTSGLLASTLWQGPRAVLFGSILLALGTGAIWFVGWTVVEVLLAPGAVVTLGSAGSVGQTLQRRAAAAGDLGAILVSNPNLVSSTTSRIYSRHLLQWPAVVAFLGVAAVLASIVLFLAKRWVERSRLEGCPPGRAEQTVEWLGRPRYFGALLERIRVRTLAREPVLWSEFRSWRLRVGIWLMPLALAPALVAWVGDAAHGHAERYEAPALVFAVLMAVAAASCLHAERASGVLELLLTAPRGVDHVWRGKVGALLLQALPSFALLLAIATAIIVGAAMATGGEAAAGRFLAGFVVSAVSRLLLVIAAGAFFSLRCRAFLPALFSTALAAGAFEVLRRWVASGSDPGNASGWIPLSEAMRWLAGQAVCSGLEILAAAVFLVLLRQTLAHRRFVVRG